MELEHRTGVQLTNVSLPPPGTYVIGNSKYLETQGTLGHSPDHNRERKDRQPWATRSLTHVLPLSPVLPPRVSMGLVSMADVTSKN